MVALDTAAGQPVVGPGESAPIDSARPAAIALRDVGKRFGPTWVVRNIDFVVELTVRSQVLAA